MSEVRKRQRSEDGSADPPAIAPPASRCEALRAGKHERAGYLSACGHAQAGADLRRLKEKQKTGSRKGAKGANQIRTQDRDCAY